MTTDQTGQAEDMSAWIGHTVVDSSGDKIGKVSDIYLDDVTGAPEWLAVKTGLLGNRTNFVPLTGAAPNGDDLQGRFEKGQVTDAPSAEADGHLSQSEEATLYEHYGLTYTESYSDSGLSDGDAGRVVDVDEGADVARDTSGPSTDAAMTRSEEELRAGTRTTEAGRVRLRKHIVTEDQQVTVPVQREQVEVIREPISAENRDSAMSGPDLSEEEAEMVLHEEQVVVEKTVVPKERVRLDKDVVTEQETVDAQVRKEVIETEGDV